MKLAIQADDPLSFVMVDNLLLATTPDQVWVIDQLGQKKRTNLESIDTETKRIIRVASVNRDNIYINRFPDWRLEAYSLSQNSKLWDFLPGRGSTDVFYDDNKDVAYVTTRYNSFYAIDNATGVLLWKNDIPTLRTTYKDGIIYAVEKTEKSNKIKISSFDVKNQKNVWQSEIEFDPSVYFIKIIDNLVIIGGDEGLLAVKKNDGSKVWQTPKGESFMSEPVDYDGVIYDRGTSRTVYAISPDDGNFVGYVTLESSEAVEPMYKLVSGVQRIRNGIVFNTRHDVWKYEKDGSSLQ
jgi:outer membrane protein assembly factor BamB